MPKKAWKTCYLCGRPINPNTDHVMVRAPKPTTLNNQMVWPMVAIHASHPGVNKHAGREEVGVGDHKGATGERGAVRGKRRATQGQAKGQKETVTAGPTDTQGDDAKNRSLPRK